MIHRKGYGSVDGKPLTVQSPLKFASVTKQFAAMCALMLIEGGKLSLKDKVKDHLPDQNFPMQGRELLIQDLLWHTSGLANFINSKERDSIAEFKARRGLDYLTNETHAHWLATMPLERPPGAAHQYTNSGYVLLARIIEVIADEPFHEFQQRRIFGRNRGGIQRSVIPILKKDRALRDDPLDALVFADGIHILSIRNAKFRQ